MLNYYLKRQLKLTIHFCECRLEWPRVFHNACLKIQYVRYITNDNFNNSNNLIVMKHMFIRKIPWGRDRLPTPVFLGFPGGSAGKESACNVRDLGSIPGLGRSPREGISYLLWFPWASLVAKMVKNMPAMRETWVWSLGWEDSLEKGTATHSSILAWRIPWTEKPGGL